MLTSCLINETWGFARSLLLSRRLLHIHNGGDLMMRSPQTRNPQPQHNNNSNNKNNDNNINTHHSLARLLPLGWPLNNSSSSNSSQPSSNKFSAPFRLPTAVISFECCTTNDTLYNRINEYSPPSFHRLQQQQQQQLTVIANGIQITLEQDGGQQQQQGKEK